MKALATNALGIPRQTTGEAMFSLFMFALSIGVTAAAGYLLLTEPARLNELWESIRSLPLLVQVAMWALLLPWMIALWIWVMPWALPIRLVLVIGILGFVNWLLFPWKS